MASHIFSSASAEELLSLYFTLKKNISLSLYLYIDIDILLFFNIAYSQPRKIKMYKGKLTLVYFNYSILYSPSK